MIDQMERRHFRWRSNWRVIFIAYFIPAIGVAMMAMNNQFMPLKIYRSVSIVCFVLYLIDKFQAQTGGYRVSKMFLHLIELCGGWPGALLGQQILRHKFSKPSYQFMFWCIVALHEIFWIDYVLNDGRWVQKNIGSEVYIW